MVVLRWWEIVNNVSSSRLDVWHLFGRMIGPVIVGELANTKVFDNFSRVGTVSYIFVRSSRICAGILDQKFLASWVVFLVFGDIIYVIPQHNPEVFGRVVFLDLLEAVHAITHVGDRGSVAKALSDTVYKRCEYFRQATFGTVIAGMSGVPVWDLGRDGLASGVGHAGEQDQLDNQPRTEVLDRKRRFLP